MVLCSFVLLDFTSKFTSRRRCRRATRSTVYGKPRELRSAFYSRPSKRPRNSSNSSLGVASDGSGSARTRRSAWWRVMYGAL